MTTATSAQQQALLALQEVDTAIRQLAHRRAHLPEQQALDAETATRARVRDELATAQSELATATARQEALEEEVRTVETRRKTEDRRMYAGQITSERELAALRGELSALKARKSDLEDTLLEVMERREELEALLVELTQRLSELEASLVELTAARDRAATDIDAELVARRSERAGRVEPLPADLVAFYETLAARKQGVAVAELSGRTCAGCRLQLTAIELEAVRAEAKGGLPRCEHCERILVLTG